MQCPNCGVAVGEKPRTCHHCGKKTFSAICTYCGAELIHRDPPIQRLTEISNVSMININQIPQYKLQNKRKKSGVRSFIYLFALILFVSVLFIGFKNNEKLEEQNNNSEIDIPSSDITGMELLTFKGHPKFFGDFKEADAFYDRCKKVNISNPASASNDERSLLAMAEYDNNKITYISINFSMLEDIKHELTLDDVLKVTCEYIPFDILNQNYSFKEALYMTREDGLETYYYAMRFNDVKEERKGYINDYLFLIKIIHRSNDDWIVYMEEGWDDWDRDDLVSCFSEVEEWTVDLKSYQ
jgi:hypothetical protein